MIAAAPQIPSYAQGFARCGAESAEPGLWAGLVGLWAPSLGPTWNAVTDWSGRANLGTLANTPDWVASPYGWALDFDGNSDYLNTTKALNSLIDLTGSFTVAHWAKPSTSSYQYLHYSRASGETAEIRCVLGYGTKDLYWRIADDDGRTVELVHNNFSATGNDWYHFVCRKVGSGANGGGLDFAINGLVQSDVTRSGFVTGILYDTKFYAPIQWLGRPGTPYALEGPVGDCALWNRALADAEIRRLYQDPWVLLRRRRKTRGVAADVPPTEGGPYRTTAGHAFHTGAAAGRLFVAGQAAGQTTLPGQIAGQIHG